MINKINISNLQLFDKEGEVLPVADTLQKQIQEGIANKVEDLLNTQEFINIFIPNKLDYDEMNLCIRLTTDGITVEVLEETPQLEAKKVPQKTLSRSLKEKKEELIKKANCLFNKPSSVNGFASLHSRNIHPLLRTPAIPSRENTTPFEIGFDANIVPSPIQRLDARIEELQSQLNKQISHSIKFSEIKNQLKLLECAVKNLSNNTQDIRYPQREEYTLINKLIENQHIICQALLNLLAKNVSSSLNHNIEDSIFKDMFSKLEFATDLINDKLQSLSQVHEKASKLLEKKQQEILNLQKTLEVINKLEKEKLRSVLDEPNLSTEDLHKDKKDFQEKPSALQRQNITTAKQTKLEQTLPATKEPIDDFEQEKYSPEISVDSVNKAYREALLLVAQKDRDFNKLQTQLSDIQQELSIITEKEFQSSSNERKLHEEKAALKKQLSLLQAALQKQTDQLNQSNNYNQTEIEGLKDVIINLRKNISSKDLQIQNLKIQIQEQENTLRASLNTKDETCNLLKEKQKEVVALQENLEIIPRLHLQLSALQQEKAILEYKLQEQISATTARQTELEQTLLVKEDFIAELRRSSSLINEEYLENLQIKEEKIVELQEKIESATLDLNRLQHQLRAIQENQIALQETLHFKEELIAELEQEKVRLEQTNLSMQTTLEKDLEADQNVANMLEQINVFPENTLEKTNSIFSEEASDLFSNPDENLARRYNPNYYVISSLDDEISSDAESSNLADLSARDSLDVEQTEEANLQSTITKLQEEIDKNFIYNTESNTVPVEEVERIIRKLSSELLKKEAAIKLLEDAFISLSKSASNLEGKLINTHKISSKLEHMQQEKEDLSEDNEGLQKRIDDLNKQIQAEKISKANLESSYVDQIKELQEEQQNTIGKVQEFYDLLLSNIFDKTPHAISYVEDSLAKLKENTPEDLLELIRVLNPSSISEGEDLPFPSDIELETNAEQFEGVGERLASNVFSRPKPLKKQKRRPYSI